MSRALSVALRQEIYGSESSDVFIALITIDHADLAAPIRVSSDAVDTISNGDTYTAFPFELILPDDTDNNAPRAKLRIDNVSREIVLAVRSVSSSPSVQIDIVLASDPDTVEATFPDFKFTNISYDHLVVEGDLTVEDFTSEPFPARVFSPKDFPGIF